MSPLADYKHSAPVRRVLRSLVPIVCPPDAEELGLVDDIVDHVEQTMRSTPAAIRAGLVAGLISYELAAMAWPTHMGRPASRLDRQRAERYFASWWKSPLLPQRQFAKGIKGIMCVACYEMGPMKARIGYTPEAWIEKVTAHRHRTYADAIRAQEAALIAPDPLPTRSSDRRAREAG